jgi:hypothetical protein
VREIVEYELGRTWREKGCDVCDNAKYHIQASQILEYGIPSLLQNISQTNHLLMTVILYSVN